MTDKSEFIKAGISYNELLEELQDKFSLSEWSARQIVSIVVNWLEECND